MENALFVEYESVGSEGLRGALMQLSKRNILVLRLVPRLFTCYPEIDLTENGIRRAYVKSLVLKMFQRGEDG
jgi:hypothetical protein